ncbi:MAG: 3-dehydroquinate synthase [Oscillospiraceae bacterium]|jgi:3-dehydroquinate synthase|nr:3-dehydroquinate synthase [Oscillospiraceae bacterium]
MKLVEVCASRSYPVKIGSGSLSAIGAELAAIAKGSVLVVTDETVAQLYLSQVLRALREAGFTAYSASIPAGEASKDMRHYAMLLDILASKQLTRSDTVLALGGGVVGDLAGFAAATYLRGLRFVQVPTTLLAMVDSSVGGKTAIDLAAGKNLVGAFHQPALVLCDPEVLRTLPESVFQDGCAEIIKTAILFDRELFAHLQAQGKNFDREYVISRCVACKRDIVCADEFDTGQRQLLNLGHTVGHAVETLSAYRISHGSAVAIGTAIMSRAYCKDKDCIVRLLEAFGLPTATDYSAAQLAQAALQDKKRAGGYITLVVPRALARCELQKVPIAELTSIIEAGL